MADSTAKQKLTAPVTILGRTMQVKRPTDAQVTLMHRWGLITDQTLRKADGIQDEALATEDPEARQALEEKAEPHFTAGMKSLAEILDTIGYLVVEDEDREFLVDQMKRGNLEVAALLTVFDPFTKKAAVKSGPAKRTR